MVTKGRCGEHGHELTTEATLGVPGWEWVAREASQERCFVSGSSEAKVRGQMAQEGEAALHAAPGFHVGLPPGTLCWQSLCSFLQLQLLTLM